MGDTLSISEFERLLSRGRGKAIVYLQTHDAAPYREVIRRCCLTNTVYGRQCKDPREIYLIYDINPCSRCREDVVESLVSLNALPDWIAEECRYDANLDLRAYAERGFKDDDDPDD